MPICPAEMALLAQKDSSDSFGFESTTSRCLNSGESCCKAGKVAIQRRPRSRSSFSGPSRRLVSVFLGFRELIGALIVTIGFTLSQLGHARRGSQRIGFRGAHYTIIVKRDTEAILYVQSGRYQIMLNHVDRQSFARSKYVATGWHGLTVGLLRAQKARERGKNGKVRSFGSCCLHKGGHTSESYGSAVATSATICYSYYPSRMFL